MTRLDSPQIVVRTAVTLLLLAFSALFLVSAGFAQEANKILIVHGELESEGWYRSFDRTLVDHFSADYPYQTVVTTRNLELSRATTPETLERIRSELETEIQEIGFDVVIAVLPSASEFLLGLENPLRIPFILTVPSDAVAGNPDLPDYVGVVASSVRVAMARTVDQILTLRPQTDTIEVTSGNHPSNLTYVEYMQDAADGYTDRVEFIYHVGFAPDELESYVSQLPDTSALITLPYFQVDAQQTLLADSITRDINAAASVPAFMVMDNGIELGAAGGHFTSSAAYASAAALLAERALAGEDISGVQSRDAASTIYDWNAVNRWDLLVDRLKGPVQIVNQPPALWREYPVATAVIANIMLALIAIAVFQSILLRRSEKARVQVEASEMLARESEERYRLLAANTVDVIWVWDPIESRLQYCSPSIEQVIGYPVEELLTIPLKNWMTPQSYESFANSFYQAEPVPTVLEIDYFHKDGHIVNCEIAMKPAKIRHGTAYEWVGVTRDITARKAEECRRQELESQVRQAQKFESLGTLAGGIAHDFNNILSVMMGTVDILKLRLNSDKETSRMLDRLMSASEKAKGLVQQILTFSRQSENKKVVTNLTALVNDCLDMMAAGAPENVTLTPELGAVPIQVKGDQSQLSQVIMNLVTNAFEATADGGEIKLSLQSIDLDTETHCTIGVLPPGNYVRITVRDNGAGILPEDIEKVFDPFYTKKEMGNGLGLAIVQGIVAEHFGGIDIESERQVGTSISVYLPVTQESVSQTNGPGYTGNPAANRRVLVVDDQEEILEMMSAMLLSLGHDCTTCHSADSALKVLSKDTSSFDLIITDYSMPGKSGLELSKTCAEEFADIPVVIATGFGKRLHEQIGPDAEVAGILDKPFNLETLKQIMVQHT